MLLYLFEQTCEQSGSQEGNPFVMPVMLVLIFVVFYFFMIRPQQKRQKEHQKLLAALKKGDRVVTSSGIHGTVVNVKERTVMLLIADGVKVEIEKGHVANKSEKSKSS